MIGYVDMSVLNGSNTACKLPGFREDERFLGRLLALFYRCPTPEESL
jgi:hypothetical protein